MLIFTFDMSHGIVTVTHREQEQEWSFIQDLNNVNVYTINKHTRDKLLCSELVANLQVEKHAVYKRNLWVNNYRPINAINRIQSETNTLLERSWGTDPQYKPICGGTVLVNRWEQTLRLFIK